MTNAVPNALDWTGEFAHDHDVDVETLAEVVDSRVPRAPLVIVMIIALFALTVVTMGTTSLYRIPYYLGVVSALFALLVYFQYSLPIPTPVMIYASWVAWSLLTALAAEMGEVIYYAISTIVQIMIMFAIFSTICQDGRSVWIVGAALVLGSLVNFASAAVFGVNVAAGRSAGLLLNPNGAALIYGIAICIILPAIAATRNPMLRLMIFATLAILLYGTVTTGSRGGAIACVIPILYFLWSYRQAIMHKPALVSFLVFVALAGAIILPARLAETELGKRWSSAVETVSSGSSVHGGSVTRRMDLKQKAVNVAIEHPFIGVGVGNFVPFVFRTMGETHGTHDNYLDILVGTGIPGFFMYYAIYVWIWVVAGRLRKSPFISDSEIAILAMTRMFIVFRALWDLFDNTGWSFKPTWILFAVLAGFLTGLKSRIQQRSAMSTAYGLA